jgi:Fic family protein
MLDIGNILITPEILKLIADIDEFKGRWKAIETLAPERLTSLRRIATIESVGSSTRIEGSKLSDAEVEKLLSGMETKSFASRDEQEVAGYADAIDMIFASHDAITLTENHIKQLHGVLLKYSIKDQDHRRFYKKVPNHVETFAPDGKSMGVIFETATPFETPGWMKELVEWFNQSVQEENQHPLILIGIFIVVFLGIHPFKDSNGRLSRILTTLLLLRAGYGYVPYSSMETVIEANKDSYYLALRRTQQTVRMEDQSWEPWLVFFLKNDGKAKR